MTTIPKYIFIIPYRDRFLEKIHFSNYIKYILEDYNESSYAIYYSEQLDNRPFNRGATKNIGFLAIKELYPDNYKDIKFIFNDVDTIPIQKNILNFDVDFNNIKHYYGFTTTLGGIFSIRGKDFEYILGFSNNWGWGLEDNVILDRAIKNKINIDRDNFFKYKDENILHTSINNIKNIANNEPARYMKKLLDNINDITDLKYTIVNNIIDENSYKNQYVIKIESFSTKYKHSDTLYYDQNLSKNPKLVNNKLKTDIFKMNFIQR